MQTMAEMLEPPVRDWMRAAAAVPPPVQKAPMARGTRRS